MKIYKDKIELIETHISGTDSVLDLGFWGQGVNVNNPKWIHKILKNRARKVYGLDIEFDQSVYKGPLYIQASAENFLLPEKVDILFAGDLIEHVSNPGLFLESCLRNVSKDGKLIISTPNTFNLFTMTEKMSKGEPTINPEHVFYFNEKTLRTLLHRHGWEVVEVSFLYRLFVEHRESWKKKVLNVVYKLLSLATPRYVETIVIVAKPK